MPQYEGQGQVGEANTPSLRAIVKQDIIDAVTQETGEPAKFVQNCLNRHILSIKMDIAMGRGFHFRGIGSLSIGTNGTVSFDNRRRMRAKKITEQITDLQEKSGYTCAGAVVRAFGKHLKYVQEDVSIMEIYGLGSFYRYNTHMEFTIHEHFQRML